jgi:hypothetical protein
MTASIVLIVILLVMALILAQAPKKHKPSSYAPYELRAHNGGSGDSVGKCRHNRCRRQSR